MDVQDCYRTPLTLSAVIAVLLCSCSAFLETPGPVEARRLYNQRIGKEVASAVDGSETRLSVKTTVQTDDGMYEFLPYLASVQLIKGKLYLHGTIRKEDGSAGDYIGIPYSRIRQLAVDWPVEVVMNDSTSLGAPAGGWKAIFVNSAMIAMELISFEHGNPVLTLVPAERIRYVRGGDPSMTMYQILEILDCVGKLLYP